MWSAWRGVLHRARQLEPVALQHALEQLLGAGLRERHLAGRELVEHRLLALDADRSQPSVRERQREGKADPAEADDGDARFHAAAVYLRSLRYWRANASTKRGLK